MITRRLQRHESGPCPFPIVTKEEACAFKIPQNEEEWALEEKKVKIDANDLVHQLGPAGFRKWLNTSPTYCIKWDESEIVPSGILRKCYPFMRDEIIVDLLRRSETLNIIAPPKAGKSWFGLNIAMNIIGGGQLFGRFQCKRGKVLIIDNELHPETIASRIVAVSGALNIPVERTDVLIDYLPLRGKLTDLVQLEAKIENIRRREYNVVILDAFYKFYPADFDENSNSEMARLYTLLDAYAEHLDSALILIHHSSKGNQQGKSVTDMGAGAGAQSRACDAHVVLREHETPGVFIIETANRSFAPNPPFCARFSYPRWLAADNYSVDDYKVNKKKDEHGSKKVGSPQPDERKASEKLKVEEFFSNEVTRPMSIAEILELGQPHQFRVWNRDLFKTLIPMFLDEKKIRLVSKSSGRLPATYISTRMKIRTEPLQLAVRNQPSSPPEFDNEGYTSGYFSEENVNFDDNSEPPE